MKVPHKVKFLDCDYDNDLYEKILKKRKKGKNESLRDTYKYKKRAARN